MSRLFHFDWDEANVEHTAKHGVSRSDIEFVLKNDPIVRPDVYPSILEQRWRGVGRDKTGRYIFVAFTLREVNKVLHIRPISARYMHKREIQTYEQTKKT